MGILLALGSAGLFVLLLLRRFVLGAEVQGVFTLFAITFFLLGTILFALGLLGEYIGRIYQQVRARPRYLVQAVLDQRPPSGDTYGAYVSRSAPSGSSNVRPQAPAAGGR